MWKLWGRLKTVLFHKKATVVFFLKLSVSSGLIIYLIWLVDWKRVLKILVEADKGFLLIVPLLLFIRLGFAVLRWRVILADSRVLLPFWHAYTSYLVGAFYNIMFPGVTGGDVMRIGRCIRHTQCQPGTATASVLIERMSGIFALMFIALGTYIVFPTTLSSLLVAETQSAVKIGAAAAIVVLVGLTSGRRRWLQWLPEQDGKGIGGFFLSGMRAFGMLRNPKLVLVLLLSVLFQTMDIVIIFLLSQMIHLTVPLAVFFAVVPLVYLAIMFPISLGGLGVREGSMAFLLAQFGVLTSDAVTLSFLVYLSRFVTAGSGGLIQLIEIFVREK